jgi:nicotine blue oxidoreductase
VAASSDSGLVRAVFGGRPGHPVVIARRHWGDVTSMLSGDEGVRAFLRGRDDLVAVECGDLASGVDVDQR